MRYKLFACCFAIRGYSRSIILDHQRGKFSLITNPICDFIRKKKEFNISDMKNNFRDRSEEIFHFLQSNEYIFQVHDTLKNLFSNIDLTFDYPAKVSNLIIDFSVQSSIHYKQLLSDVCDIGCKDVQLQCFEAVDLELINEIANYMNMSIIKNIEIVYPYSDLSESYFLKLLNENSRIRYIALFGKTKQHMISEFQHGSMIYFPDRKNEYDCGFVGMDYFCKNLIFYCESQSFNTCLNRKLSIDKEGYIKNCPYMRHHYGHISDTKIEDVVELPEFQKWWQIKKDDIEVCKDCELRYFCHDCRAYTLNNNIYGKPSKCKYNPYNNSWK